MSFIRAIKRGDKAYYQEVENKWINGKTVQKHIRYIGRDRDSPDHIPFALLKKRQNNERLIERSLRALSTSEILNDLCEDLNLNCKYVTSEQMEKQRPNLTGKVLFKLSSSHKSLSISEVESALSDLSM